ncbi:TPA: UDP-N-acetylglucosamine 2-epimerase (non-hydrolyzing) [Candidatus Micrarchaeota archaeon]|nr:UDP-N-acetylglucosamine 2-epimerase (non-hydrolyzing) [Candidatus Micrarchaeota archaeon]HIH30807.1 UDP-N-acetylglucosamine 2-epimerase (non-hydrolyzing) [Candidatus Micrarchaeota archaeon]
MKIIHAFGSRACAIKMAPLIKEGIRRGHKNVIVWSGQHYDDNLYLDLFDDLEIPRPDYDIEARGSSPEIGAKILVEFEKICKKEKPDIVLTHGDTFTAMFFSQAAALSLVPVGHVEAGLRTYSWEPFPEQICTKTSDACSALFFAATEKNRKDLLSEHAPEERIFVVGNSVVDAALEHAVLAKKKSRITERFKIRHPFVFWSCHRKENMLSEKRMTGIFGSLLDMKEVNFFCSVLPSTQLAAEKYGFADKLKNAPHIIWEKCLPKYTDALCLMLESDLVLTDSGGMQEECAALHIPCLTLRYVTDRPESVEAGANRCVGCEKENIVKEVKGILGNQAAAKRMRGTKNPYGDGKTSGRIFDIIERFKGRLERWEKKIRKEA